MKTNFPKFWFEGNLYYGWINRPYDLQAVFAHYKGQLTKDDILDKAVNKNEKLDEFGLRIEHQGKISLRQFLTEKGINKRKNYKLKYMNNLKQFNKKKEV